MSEEASPGDSPIITKRKRRQPGEWWVSSSQGLEETDVTDRQPTAKKSKQNKNKPKTALISPVNAKKDGAAKRRNQKQLVQSPVQKTQTLKKGNKIKKDKQNNNLTLKGGTPGRRKLFHEVEAGQIECQEVMDQDVGPLHSSPLDLPERNHSLNPSKKLHNTLNQIQMLLLIKPNIQNVNMEVELNFLASMFPVKTIVMFSRHSGISESIPTCLQ